MWEWAFSTLLFAHAPLSWLHNWLRLGSTAKEWKEQPLPAARMVTAPAGPDAAIGTVPTGSSIGCEEVRGA